MILSVSRRTDIPAFYSDWFFDNLKKGYVLVPNPIYAQKIARIPLRPATIKSIETNIFGERKIEMDGEIEGIVFWTKNPRPMLSRLAELGEIKYYFLYTLNGYPENIEYNLPPLEDRIVSFKILAKHCPVIWRYDPILLSKNIDVNWHINNFKMLCEKLKDSTKHCKISFVIESYKGCSKTVKRPDKQQQHDWILIIYKSAPWWCAFLQPE